MNDAKTFIAYYRARKSFSFVDLFLKKNLVLFSYSSSPTFPPWPPPPRTDDDDNQPFLPLPFFSAAAVTPELWPRFPPLLSEYYTEEEGGKKRGEVEVA